MKTIELTITKGNKTLTSQPIYADGTPAKHGDDRQGEDQYVATVSGSNPPVGAAVVFRGQHSGKTIEGRVATSESHVTGDVVITVYLPL